MLSDVIVPPPHNLEAEKSVLGAILVHNEALNYLGIRIELKKDGVPKWIAHADSNVDLVAIRLDVDISTDAVGRERLQGIPLGNFATASDVFEGASVLVYGYPEAATPRFLTRGIVRSGVIAWVDPKGPLENRLLIDAMVFPGNSGGPVFRVPIGIDRTGKINLAGGKVAFLGIVTQAPSRFSPVVVMEQNKPKEVLLNGQAKVLSNELIGIGVVEPASKVLELLERANASIK